MMMTLKFLHYAMLILLAAMPNTVRSEDIVACSTGLVQRQCPLDYPVCCVRDTIGAYGVVAACCPLGTTCQLDIGACVGPRNIVNATIPPGSLVESVGINLPMASAAGIMSFMVLVVVCLSAASIILATKVDLVLQRRREARDEAARAALDALTATEDEAESMHSQAANGDADGDEGKCNICFARGINAAFLPCGHMVSCTACARKLKNCPICRDAITRVVTVPTVLAAEHREARERVSSPAPSNSNKTAEHRTEPNTEGATSNAVDESSNASDTQLVVVAAATSGAPSPAPPDAADDDHADEAAPLVASHDARYGGVESA